MLKCFPNMVFLLLDILYNQGIIQKKSASRSRMLPSLMIFLLKFYFDIKMPKWSINGGSVVLATTIYQTKCPFTILSALFLFFWTLPYDSRLYPVFIHIYISKQVIFPFFPNLRRFKDLSLRKFARNQNITHLEINVSFLIYIYIDIFVDDL